MIEITALNKIYKSKKRKTCHALKDINLTMPDAGLVFVLGKSGSGKSTFLNLIGGLDNVTSGSIEVDGNDLAKFKEKDFCNYRNTHIGFIFQDYHLIDELTVYENIVLSLNLRKIEDKEHVKSALEKVDLAGYEDRYPTELSGGEQQRVAIARAIVKKPRIILADEPTGNLDTNTARAIVELLKELSKECLILVVSHNINDANSYADRIIELKNGEIISDKSRNPDFLDEVTLKDGNLVYPKDTYLSDRDIEFINENTGATLVKRTDKFIITPENKDNASKVKIENKSLTLGKELKLSGKFLKSKTFAIAFSSFMVAVIMVIMSLAQTIIAFDGGEIVAGEMAKSNQNSLLMNKTLSEEASNQLDRNYRVKVDDSDVQAFYDAGYKGKIYSVLNYSLPITTMSTYYGLAGSNFHKGIYLAATFGTMIVDEDFLTKKFGDYEYVARVDNFIDYGIVITDYAADSLLMWNSNYNKGKTYEDVLGELFIPGYTSARLYINGIIKTDYKEKYADLFETVKKENMSASEIYEDENAQAFLADVYDRLGYCYTTCPNFVEAYKQSGIAMHPGHYKLNFNNLIDFTTDSAPYVLGIDYVSTLTQAPNYLGNQWFYTQEIPEIPEGAKYIRVAFNDGIDVRYNIYNGVTELDCAILSINGEHVPIEVINYIRGTNEAGVALGMFDGQVVQTSEGLAYSLVSDYIEIPDGAEITEFATVAWYQKAYCAFYDENKNVISTNPVWSCNELAEGTITMSFQKYNEIFGTSYDKTNLDKFVPHKVTLSHYEYSDVNNENPLFTKEVTIVGLRDTVITLFASPEIYELFLDDFVRGQALYFDGTEGIGAVLDMAYELNFEPQSYAVEGIHTMTTAVDVFIPIFELVAIFLCIGVIFILMSFASKMIKDKMHEIGIMKALGTKNNSIGVIFGLQVALIATLTCALATVGYFAFIDLANDVLVESLMRFSPSSVVLDLDFLTFRPEIAMKNCILIMALALISLIFPMIKIKAIKPVKIIKAKE